MTPSRPSREKSSRLLLSRLKLARAEALTIQYAFRTDNNASRQGSRMNFRWPVVLLAGTLVRSGWRGPGPAKADLAKAQQIVTQVCAACHAADGNSTLAVNPVLAGQHADYTLKQLMNFKSQDGKPAERPNRGDGGHGGDSFGRRHAQSRRLFRDPEAASRARRATRSWSSSGRRSIAAASWRGTWRPAPPVTVRTAPACRPSFRGSRDSSPSTRRPS